MTPCILISENKQLKGSFVQTVLAFRVTHHHQQSSVVVCKRGRSPFTPLPCYHLWFGYDNYARSASRAASGGGTVLFCFSCSPEKMKRIQNNLLRCKSKCSMCITRGSPCSLPMLGCYLPPHTALGHLQGSVRSGSSSDTRHMVTQCSREYHRGCQTRSIKHSPFYAFGVSANRVSSCTCQPDFTA